MLVTVAIVAAVGLAALLSYAARRPNTLHIERTQTIQASPERIFGIVSDFRNFPSWSPFEKLDPAMARSYSGAASGKGAGYHWTGNKKAGEGNMEIVDTAAPSLVRIQLDFLKPFESHSTAEFRLQAKGSATAFTWAMYGPQTFMFKLMSIFVSMDKMVGKDFEEGLANLKTLAESSKSFSAKGA